MWWTNKDLGSNTSPLVLHSGYSIDRITFATPPHNCSFLKPKKSTKLNKQSFQNRLCKYINNIIIYPAIDKSDNLFLDQLSQIMEMKFNMIHLTMCNKIIGDLDCTLIIIVKNSWGFDRKLEITQEFSDPKNFHASINSTMILSFSGWQRDNLFFSKRTIAKDHHWSGTQN